MNDKTPEIDGGTTQEVRKWQGVTRNTAGRGEGAFSILQTERARQTDDRRVEREEEAVGVKAKGGCTGSGEKTQGIVARICQEKMKR